MKNWGIVFVLMVLISACNSGEQQTTSGLSYEVVRAGTGEHPVNDDVMLLHMRYEDADGNVMYDTESFGSAASILFNDSLTEENGSIEELLPLLNEGDSVIASIKAKNLYQKTFNMAVPDSMDPESNITFYIGLSQLLTKNEFNEYRKEMSQRQYEEAEAERERQLQIDVEKIDSYLAENNIEAESSETGLRYLITEEGSGTQAAYNDSVFVNYVGYLLDGTVFDTSYEEIARENGLYDERRNYQPIAFPLSKGQVIDGWVEGIGYLQVGDKATLYIPSTLAYGNRARSQVIGPNSILVFDVELVDVKKAKG